MTSSQHPTVAMLAAAVRSERTGVEALIEVLTHERHVLEHGEIDRLSDTAPRKRELLLHIAHLGEQRNRLLERCGATADRRGMEALLNANSNAGEARAEWQALMDASQKAHRLNQENGAYIDAGLRANQQALQVLTAAASRPGTYGPGGRSLNSLSSRSLASA